jgi:GDPmannose 4,6-dehydratase
VTGQDGAYLAQLLLGEGYEVVGSSRPASSPWRLTELGIADRVRLHPVDLLDFDSIATAIREIRPTEVYNLAAQSTIGESLRDPALAGELNGLAVTRLLEAIRVIDPEIRFAQASSSQMFGEAQASPQNESTPFRPRSPYAIAKLYGHLTAGHYREAHGVHACTGILFNHESPLRGPQFVTRKITRGLAAFALGSRSPIALGNTLARRDWGHARDYVRALTLMLRQDKADDYVIATGETHTVKEFAEAAARRAGLDLAWEDAGVARDGRSGAVVIKTTAALHRSESGEPLVGDASRARRELGWQPATRFPELVAEMAEADLARLKAGAVQHGSHG